MRNLFTYKHTIKACFIGYMVQAIVNNFVPLLFLTFQKMYDIPLSHITLLITTNFCVQLMVDLLSTKLIDKMGYRTSAVLAHSIAAFGLIALTILPEITVKPFYGLAMAVILYAVGGGLLEVLLSPIVEACPTDNKEAAMSLLHSFYCWGHVAVVLLSTIFFVVFGTVHWKVLAALWAIIPLLNAFFFMKVPIYDLLEEETGLSVKKLFCSKMFWLALIMMICAGASEQAVSQWASIFAEKGLQVSKTIGDLTGPMLFAVLMGISRLLYGKYGEKLNLDKFMQKSTILCIASYLIIALSPWPLISLFGCGLCGFSVGILWPGTFSMASNKIPTGGTALFALLALGGDVGCSLGPTVVGEISAAAGDKLETGMIAAVVFPALMFFCSKSIKHNR